MSQEEFYLIANIMKYKRLVVKSVKGIETNPKLLITLGVYMLSTCVSWVKSPLRMLIIEIKAKYKRGGAVGVPLEQSGGLVLVFFLPPPSKRYFNYYDTHSISRLIIII